VNRGEPRFTSTGETQTKWVRTRCVGPTGVLDLSDGTTSLTCSRSSGSRRAGAGVYLLEIPLLVAPQGPQASLVDVGVRNLLLGRALISNAAAFEDEPSTERCTASSHRHTAVARVIATDRGFEGGTYGRRGGLRRDALSRGPPGAVRGDAGEAGGQFA
jgi:hypothetical protein